MPIQIVESLLAVAHDIQVARYLIFLESHLCEEDVPQVVIHQQDFKVSFFNVVVQYRLLSVGVLSVGKPLLALYSFGQTMVWETVLHQKVWTLPKVIDIGLKYMTCTLIPSQSLRVGRGFVAFCSEFG